MNPLRQAIDQGLVSLHLNARDMRGVIGESLQLAVSQGKLSTDDLEQVEQSLLQREEQGSTAIGHSVAIPHAYLDCFEEQIICFVRLARPVNLGAPDGIPTRFAFVLLGPEKCASEHIDALTGVARLMSDDEFRFEAGVAKSPTELSAALDHYLKRTAPHEYREETADDSGMVYTGKLFGGLADDLRRRLPHYVSDFRDGLHPKVVSATLFLFFACLAPAITFGGVMDELTGGQIGAVEMLVATALCGVVYAIFSGQPLIILGGTGPLLVFTMILYQLTTKLEIPFLETRAWVGIWTALLLLILAATDASWLMRFFTRFTDETFAALISIIFIVLAVEDLVALFHGEHVEYASAFFSLILALGTFYFAMTLSRFRHSRYLRPYMREFLADFGPTIALVAMTIIAIWMRHEVSVPALEAPETVRPSIERSWFVNPLAIDNPWIAIGSLGPALLVTVLVFMDQNITARIINRPDHKLQKGPAYHWDLAVMGILIAICSLFGLPWLVAATVRSLNHVRSLATMEEVLAPGGETHERIIHVRENRVSALVIHLLVGASLLLLPLMHYVPMAVLYGLFLYMGIVSMAGNQFFERLSLWLMDSSLYPSNHYTRRVPKWTIHKFTLIQLICLLVLGWFEISPLGILFPLLIALLVPIRFAMNKFFEPEHLAMLDAEEIPEEEETHWTG